MHGHTPDELDDARPVRLVEIQVPPASTVHGLDVPMEMRVLNPYNMVNTGHELATERVILTALQLLQSLPKGARVTRVLFVCHK